MRLNKQRLVLVLVITALLFLVLFRTVVNFGDFVEAISQIDISLLILAITLGFSGPILSALRWQTILTLSGISTSFKRIFSVIMAAWPLSLLPGRVGDFARSYPLRKEVASSLTISATLFEKIIDLSALLLISSTGFFYFKNFYYGSLLLILSASLVPLLFLSKSIVRFLPEFISKKLNTILAVFSFSKLKNRLFFVTVALSLLNWLASIGEVWLLFRAVKTQVPISQVMAYLPLAIFIGLLPITVAGVGTRDSALVAFFGNYASAAQSLTVGIGYSFIGYFLFAIIGIPFLLKESELFSGNDNIVHPPP